MFSRLKSRILSLIFLSLKKDRSYLDLPVYFSVNCMKFAKHTCNIIHEAIGLITIQFSSLFQKFQDLKILIITIIVPLDYLLSCGLHEDSMNLKIITNLKTIKCKQRIYTLNLLIKQDPNRYLNRQTTIFKIIRMPTKFHVF